MTNKKKAIVVFSTLAILTLSGCSAMSTAIQKRNLEVKTQMSKTIWLDPVPASEKTVFIQVKNTSDKNLDGLDTIIAKDIKSDGYTITNSPEKAHYWIQVNVLKADKMNLRDAESFLNQGYEGALTGAALGAGITAYNSSSAGATLGVGLATGLIGMAADAMVQDINYTMVTDIQIAVRSKDNVIIKDVASLQQGTSGSRIQTSTNQSNQLKYQTRIVSNANKVNLDFNEARPVLEAQLAKSISGIL